MELPSYFADFLSEIRLTENQVDDCRRGHRTLRRRLNEDEDLSPIIVSTFLQGSYRRATAVRPKGEKRADVDVIVVTKLDRDEYTPEEALELFVKFCEKHYKGKYHVQGRSIAIELTYVDLDVVPTAAPSESERGILTNASVTTEDTPDDVGDWRLVKSWVPLSERGSAAAGVLLEAARAEEEWKLSPLYIPDREVKLWVPAHPLEQIKWTYAKNRACNGCYVKMVKALKWWRRLNPTPEYPKGYPVEQLIGQNCPDGVRSVAEAVTKTLEAMVSAYGWIVLRGQKPVLPDHGVPQHDVLKRVSVEDFAAFYGQVVEAAKVARAALDADTVRVSATKWRKLFGNKFPEPPGGDDDGGDDDGGSGGPAKGGFTERTAPTVVTGRRFA